MNYRICFYESKVGGEVHMTIEDMDDAGNPDCLHMGLLQLEEAIEFSGNEIKRRENWKKNGRKVMPHDKRPQLNWGKGNGTASDPNSVVSA